MTSRRRKSSIRCASFWRRSIFRCRRAARCGRMRSTAFWHASRAATSSGSSTKSCCAARRRPNIRRRISAISASICAATPISPRRSAATPISIVHRALIRALKLGADGLPDDTDVRALAEIAANISATERRAMKAERETADRLIAHFLADRVGATFDGHISGVTRAGLFVELDETGADGFIPARFIGDEYFRFDEAEPRLRRPCRDSPARRSGDGRTGRGRTGRRRPAFQARAAMRAAPPRKDWTSAAARAPAKFRAAEPKSSPARRQHSERRYFP